MTPKKIQYFEWLKTYKSDLSTDSVFFSVDVPNYW